MNEFGTLSESGCMDFATLYGEKFNRQLILEREMEENGSRSVQKLFDKAREKNQESNTIYGQLLLKKGVESLAEGISNFMKEAESGKAGRRHIAVKFLLEFPDVRVAAFLGLRQVLNGITARQSLNRVSNMIADALEKEANLINFKREDPELYKRMTGVIDTHNETHKYKAMSVAMGHNDIPTLGWSGEDKKHLGLKMIDLIITYTGYIEIIPMVVGKNKTVNYVMPTHKCDDWIKTCRKSALLAPEYLPCVVPPKPWTTPFDGGYYSNIKPLRMIKARFNPRNYLEEIHNRRDKMPVVYEAINALQNTAYRVNRNVYEVMAGLWNVGESGGGLVDWSDRPLPICPICGEVFGADSKTRKHECFSDKDNAEDFKIWKKEAEGVYKENVKRFSKRLQFAKVIYLAWKFKEEEAIYFPMQLDFRGRAYPVPNFLQPQGTDWAKGLLEFAKGKPLRDMEAVRWLAIHGANLHGEDKVSLDDRFLWVLENEDTIVSVAEDPFGNRWWQGADKPFQFLAFCFEWAGYVKACEKGEEFVSHMVVAMDGTCNGLQIFSLLLRDEEGGRATNLVPGDKPQDIYAIVADKVIKKLETKSVTGLRRFKKSGEEELYNERILAPLLLDLGINRKTTKRQVMTLPYGATFTSCKEYTLTWLEERRDEEPNRELFRLYPGGRLFRAAMFLGEQIWEAIHETVTAARGAMEYLQTLAGLVTKEGLPITWTTPVGLNILQAYKETRSRRIKSLLGGTVVEIKDKEETTRLDISEQKNGISPNFIHSLDAAAMMKTVSIALNEGVTSFAMVHDSYGTHAGDAEALAGALRRAFTELFREDLLAEFRDEVVKVLPPEVREDIPLLPPKGGLQIEEVLESKYFFA